MFHYGEGPMEPFEQDSLEATEDCRLPDYNNTKSTDNYGLFQDRPTQMNEYSQDVNLADGFWPRDDIWSIEGSWLPYSPGRINEAPRVSASEAPHLISDTDDHGNQMGHLQVPGSMIETPSSTVSLKVNTSFACERCSRPFHKMYLLNRHRETHNPTVRCPIDSCTHRTARRRDMRRHVAARHPNYVEQRIGYPTPRPMCPVPDCKYAKMGFARKDHMKRHLRRKHPEHPLLTPKLHH